MPSFTVLRGIGSICRLFSACNNTLQEALDYIEAVNQSSHTKMVQFLPRVGGTVCRFHVQEKPHIVLILLDEASLTLVSSDSTTSHQTLILPTVDEPRRGPRCRRGPPLIEFPWPHWKHTPTCQFQSAPLISKWPPWNWGHGQQKQEPGWWEGAERGKIKSLVPDETQGVDSAVEEMRPGNV